MRGLGCVLRAACWLDLRRLWQVHATVALVTISLVIASERPSEAKSAHKTGPTVLPDTTDDRFQPYAFIGEVNNRFAGEARNVLDRRAKDDRDRVDHAAGFGFDYRVLGRTTGRWQLVFGGQTIHTARSKVAEIDSVNRRDCLRGIGVPTASLGLESVFRTQGHRARHGPVL